MIFALGVYFSLPRPPIAIKAELSLTCTQQTELDSVILVGHFSSGRSVALTAR